MILIILYLIGFIGCETSPQNETDDSLDTFLDPILDTTLNTTEEEKEIVTQERCPYPPPDTIAPCECLADEELRANLHCSLENSDFDEDLMSRIVSAFGCQNEIFKFDVDLHRNKMMIDFDRNGFGKLKVTHFRMKNFSRTGSILAGGINPPMTTFKIEDSPALEEPSSVGVRAFDNVQSLKTVSLGNSFNKVGKYGFRNLTSLQKLEISPASLSSIEEAAFTNLPAISSIDLSNQNLGKLPKSSIKSCRNLTYINFANSKIKTIEKDSIQDVENLRRLDLSNNEICEVGNLVQNIQNEDIIMELSGNNIRYLLEEQFRPFVEARKNKGYINLGDNTLHCQCDMKWLLTTNYKWSDVLFNGTCADGRGINKMNWRLLQKMCPTDECHSYEKEIGRPKKEEKDVLEISSNGYPSNEYFYDGTVKTETFSGPATLKFLTNTCHYRSSYNSYNSRSRDIYVKIINLTSGKTFLSSTRWTSDMEKIHTFTNSQDFQIELKYSGYSESCRYQLKIEKPIPTDYCT